MQFLTVSFDQRLRTKTNTQSDCVTNWTQYLTNTKIIFFKLFSDQIPIYNQIHHHIHLFFTMHHLYSWFVTYVGTHKNPKSSNLQIIFNFTDRYNQETKFDIRYWNVNEQIDLVWTQNQIIKSKSVLIIVSFINYDSRIDEQKILRYNNYRLEMSRHAWFISHDFNEQDPG